ncbi:MAG: hypothetical protein IJ546_03600 [Prevotella sp.]|nr:hypothetical protein [Prevotella sp.]
MKIARILMIGMAAWLVSTYATAQDESRQREVRKYLRKGNRLFHAGQREKASTNYLKANKTDPSDPRSLYNLNTSLLPEQYWRLWPNVQDSVLKKDVARMDSAFHEAADREQTPLRKSLSYHNLGVMYQSLYQSKGNEEYLMKAIDAYKDVLRNNPTDNEARYNLVVCQKQLKNTPQNQQNQQPPQNQQNEDKQQQQPTMDKENIEQLLKAATQKEKDAQKRMQEAQPQGRPTNRKNW